MNEIIDDVNELKRIIEQSKEYKEYKKYTSLLDNNKEINKLINEIKKLQQSIVKLEIAKKDCKKEEEELNFLFDELNNIKLYQNYLNASKNLNILITSVQNSFSSTYKELMN